MATDIYLSAFHGAHKELSIAQAPHCTGHGQQSTAPLLLGSWKATLLCSSAPQASTEQARMQGKHKRGATPVPTFHLDWHPHAAREGGSGLYRSTRCNG